MKVKANGIDIEVEDSGGSGEPLLLIMGLGVQLVHWPPYFVQPLVEAGYRVIRLDNRDIGLSQYFPQFGRPNPTWGGLMLALGRQVEAPYTLGDMAADALGVLDALGIERAHVAGASMGGMIAQRLALAAPERVRSLVSIMSTSGARGLPKPASHVVRAMLARPRNGGREALLRYYVELYRIIGGPSYDQPEADLRAAITVSLDRAQNPDGMLRQLRAIMADTRRADELTKMRVPTLVLHGREDPLVPVNCGADTARRIPDSRYVVIERMGHALPPSVSRPVVAEMIPFLRAHPIEAAEPAPALAA